MATEQLKKRTNFFIKALIFTFIIFCVITLITQFIEKSSLTDERKALESDFYAAQLDNEQLQEELDRPFDDAYIMQIARTKLHYHLPEEILFYNDLLK